MEQSCLGKANHFSRRGKKWKHNKGEAKFHVPTRTELKERKDFFEIPSLLQTSFSLPAGVGSASG